MTIYVSTAPEAGNVAQYLVDTRSQFALTNNTTSASGRVYLSQIVVEKTVTATAIVYFVQTQSGNVRAGIYSEGSAGTPASGTLLASTVETAVGGGSASQTLNLTSSVVLAPGRYYIAIEFDNALMAFQRVTSSINLSGAGYIFNQTYGALPSTCPAVSADATTPTCGLLLSIT